MIGQTVSHYKILEKLGEGGMGIVYKAHDTKLDRIVALKFLPARLNTNEAEKARFLQEAKAAATLNHPHVCTIYRIDEHDGLQFIEMEYVDGVTLRNKVPIQKQAEAVEYAIQIGDALHDAHSKGIVHRDVKAENIMVNSRNQIKVMDFGLAKLKGSMKLTRTSSTVGTLAYMAPEQIQGGEVDARSDIFSFGIVLFEMLTGRTPFRGEHEAAVLYSIVNEPPESLLALRPELSPELERIISLAIEKDPEDRYQQIDHMVSELRRVQKQSTKVVRTAIRDAAPATSAPVPMISTPQPAQAQPTGPVPSVTSRKRMYILGGTLVVFLAAGAALYFSLFDGHRSIDSLAVLPFTNVTTDPNVEYLTDGITENITNNLSKLSKLRVVPRSLVEKYKGKIVDPREAGKDLNVSAVLMGKVTQRGDELIVQTELIDIQNVSQLWGEQYNKKMSDIVDVQDDIAQNVAGKLQTQVTGDEQRKLAAQRTVNPEAYQLYLKGHFQAGKRSAEGYRKAVELYQQAINIDPNFALAYYGLAEAYVIGVTIDLGAKETMPKIRANVLKALELDPSMGEAYSNLAAVQAYSDYDFAAAEKSFRKGIELNPNFATVHHWFGEFLIYMNRFDEGLKEYQRATELDPASLAIASDFGIGYFNMRKYDQSIEFLKKTIDMDPNFVRTHFYITQPYLKKGMYDEAMDETFKGMAANGAGAKEIDALKKLYASSGIKGVAREEVDRLTRTSPDAVSGDIFGWLSILGDKERALSLLEKAYDDREVYCVTTNVTPVWDFLRDEPRFKAILKKIGFEHYSANANQ